jgi:TolB-like protein/Flp pilus assembly protein TadD
MSSDPEDGYFADGMTEEIITSLSRCSGMTVIARNSSFTYKGRAVDIRQIGRDLGAGYVLEGSIRRSRETLRITAQLIDAGTGSHLWAERFDGEMSDAFELQDRIAGCVVGIVEPRMRFSEVDNAARSRIANPTVYQLWLKAVALAGDLSRATMMEAIRMLESARDLEPANALVLATLSYYRAQCQFQGWLHEADDMAKEALALAWRAIALDDRDGNVQWMAAFAIWTFARDADRARELFRRSLEINPNNALAHILSGWVEVAVGDPVGGRRLIERAFILNPRHPRAWFMSAGMAITYIAQARFGDTLPWAEKATVQNRRSAVALRALAVVYAQLGYTAKAKEVGRELLGIDPTLSLSKLRVALPWLEPHMLDTYIEGLRIAGVPE